MIHVLVIGGAHALKNCVGICNAAQAIAFAAVAPKMDQYHAVPCKG